MCDVNVGLKLQHYEVEYCVMHELMSAGPANESLHKQNQELIEHIAECKGSIATYNMNTLQEQIMVKAKVEVENMATMQINLC